MASKQYRITSSVLAIVAASPALAGEPLAPGSLPAVSAPNFKAAVRGGTVDDEGSVVGDFAWTTPLGHAYGFQLDGAIGHYGPGDNTLASVTGHLFWRDPSRGLFGLYGGYTSLEDAEFYSIGAQGHIYLGRMSLEGKLGHEGADTDDGLFASLKLAFYPMEDLRLYGGVRHSEWRDGLLEAPGTLGVAGLEYQTRWGAGRHSISLFGEGRFGDDYNAVWGGLRVYFGPAKSLIRRHREDDPDTDVPDLVEIIEVAPPPPPPPPPPPK